MTGFDPRLLERILEVGQAVASVTFAATAMGWDARFLGPIRGFTELKIGLGNEFPVVAIFIFPNPANTLLGGATTVSELKSRIMKTFTGNADWWDDDWKMEMAEKTECDEHVSLGRLRYCATGRDFRYEGRATLRQALKWRESISAADLDGDYNMPRGNFWQFLLRCCYGDNTESHGHRGGVFPCGVLPWIPTVNVFVFVNRVDGFEIGLYCLVRNRGFLASNQGGSARYQWKAQRLNAEDDPSPFVFDEKLFLFRSAPPEPRHKESAVLVAMVAPFKCFMEAGYNKWMYSRQIWEAGFLGEVLTVEAQALGLSVSALKSQDYDWNSALGINTADGDVISVYGVGKRKEEGGN